MRETTNLGLKITEGSDDWRNIFDDNADNMDVLDEAVTKDASTTQAGRVNTGEQEFAGTKTFTGLKSKNAMNVHGANSANYNVRLSGAPTDSGADGLIGIFSAVYSNLKSWLTMKVYGVNSQGKRINYYDEYKLPETAADKSANNTYDILTTKEVTLDANSQKAARRNISAVSNAEVAIMANGNTHVAIASGQAVIVRNHSSLSDGLYWASTAIATNATLSTSNLTADTSGGLNKLKGDIDSLNSNYEFHPTANSEVVDNVTINGIRYGKVCKMTYYMRFKTAISGWGNVATIPTGYIPVIQQYGICSVDSSVSPGEGKIAETRVLTNGHFEIFDPVPGVYLGEIVYICS